MKRILAASLTLGVAVATVSSALALGSLAEPASSEAQDPPPPTKVTVEVEVKQVFTATTTTAKATAPVADDKFEEKPVRVLRAAPAPRAAAVKKAAPVAAVAAAPVMMGNVMAMNNDAQVVQYMQQIRPILRSEYHIVRAVCRPTPEQSKDLAKAGEQALREACQKYVAMMRQPMTPTQRAANEPRKIIRNGLVAAVKAKVSPEAAARLEAEGNRREAGRKGLFVRNLVARLDHDLILAPDQRDKIADSLTKHWDDSWGQSLEMFMYDYQYLPPIPDNLVAPSLNEAQKKIWRGTQKVQMFFGGFGLMGGVMVDDPLEDEELRAARVEAAKNNPVPARMKNAPARILRAPAAQKAATKVEMKVVRKQFQAVEKAVAVPAGKTTVETKPVPPPATKAAPR